MITRAVMVSVTSVLLGEGSLTPLSTFNQISTLISVFFGCQHKNLCLSFCRWKAQLASALERFTEGLRHCCLLGVPRWTDVDGERGTDEVWSWLVTRAMCKAGRPVGSQLAPAFPFA